MYQFVASHRILIINFHAVRLSELFNSELVHQSERTATFKAIHTCRCFPDADDAGRWSVIAAVGDAYN
jgi:hypothetical protein